MARRKPTREQFILAVKTVEEYLGGMHSVPQQNGDGDPPMTVSEAGRKGGAARARKLRKTPEGRARLVEIARLGGEKARGRSGRPRKKPAENNT